MTKRRRVSTRKRVRRSPEKARAHILSAAVRVLSKNGPAAVGLKDVAREAGVSHALITHYFGTYEALVDAAIFEAMSTVRAHLIEQLLATPDAKPEEVVQLYFDTALEPWHGRLIGWALLADHERSSRYAEQLVPDMKLIAAGTEYMMNRRMESPPTRRQVEALIVTVWSMAIGYVIANGFFWRALGRKPGPGRDRDIRDTLATLSRSLFDRDGPA